MSTVGDDRQGGARYLQAFRDHWLLIVGLVVVAVGLAVAYSLTADERYDAEADLLVMPVGDDETFIGIALLRESSQTRAVLTAARLVQSPQIAQGVSEEIGGDRDALLNAIQVEPLGQSNILTIEATAGTGARAAEIANAFADELVEQRTLEFERQLRSVVERLEARLDTIPDDELDAPEAEAIQQRLAELNALLGAQDPTLQITSRAVAPESPSWPRPALSVAVAFLAALLLGSGAAAALALVNPRVTREDELLLEQRLPVLARIPRLPRKALRGYLAGSDPLPGDVREAYRTLRATLETAGADGGFPRTLLVTSAIPGEGKTMTSVNLAITTALAGSRVVLVDGDFRRPMVSTVLGVPPRRSGLAHLLLGEASLDDSLAEVPGYGENLRVLTASPEHAHLVDLIKPHQVERAMRQLRDEADVVVIDSPPVTQVADALLLADAVDATLVAVRLGRTRRDKLSELRRMLAQRDVSPIGFVVTMRRRSRARGYYYGGSTARDVEIREREARQPALARPEGDGENFV